MTENNEPMDQLLNTPDLAGVLESDQFRQFLDQVPIAIAVSELNPVERIVYANIEFERLSGQAAADLEGATWSVLSGEAVAEGGKALSGAIVDDQDYIGAFSFAHDDGQQAVDAWSNVIQDDAGQPVFRMLALVGAAPRDTDLSEFEQRIQDKDLLLRELQHRVANNLQMITALIRIEARNVPENATDDRFSRLAGRVEALGLLYRSLSDESQAETVDLGVYLSEIASAVMRAHAQEGIHLNLQVDTWMVSINVAMPAGLVVNELLTNALKHAFKAREGGTIQLHSLVDQTGCRVIVADDGVGLAPGYSWPRPGKLSNMIVQSLRQNAHARVEVESQPGEGMRVTVFFTRADAAPPAS
ncbi:histidine kinase dimerization/phosphoacceptor domain -containing protein [Caulobacter sp. BE254]|uniref:sensor histidine kinase n=1 Tax=Caulobacter sp. BE254 TaxID=2817720 RepID=UPI0028570A55|nr:histidine kinase dimerization/phosphoacceptor domain -containing protein [Caulobacter sp. BE254]MDR7114279.1 two-component sensor histidine kinase [Caulobacter sp. BE254]